MGLALSVGADGPVAEAMTGVTLLIVTFVLANPDFGAALPFVVPLSVTVTLATYVSDGVAVGASSR